MKEAAIINAKAEVYLELMKFVSQQVDAKLPANQILVEITNYVEDHARTLLKELTQ